MSAGQSDPTASGFHPPARGAARLSGNEAEALCLKAARGGGMPWGLAEEAGFAARWLYARGIDGPGTLLSHLDWLQGRGPEEVRPASFGALQAQGGGAYCSVALGAALSDFCALPQGVVGPVHAPVLIVPFLHSIARAQTRPVRVEWNGKAGAVGAEGEIAGQLPALTGESHALIRLAFTEESIAALPVPERHAPLTETVLKRLDAYAMRTTVPASGTSRADAGEAPGNNE